MGTDHGNECGLELGCGLVAVFQTQGQRFAHYWLEWLQDAFIVVCFEAIDLHAVDGDGRGLAHQHPVERGTGTEDISPGAKTAIALVLLQRRIALGEHHRDAAMLQSGRFFGRAKVEQDGLAYCRQVDVVRLHIAMHHATLVHVGEAVEQHLHQATRHIHVQRRTHLAEVGIEGHALVVIHHHVGGVVGVEEGSDAHHIGVVEFGDDARLPQELIFAGVEAFAVVGGVHGDVEGIRHPRSHFWRQKLLDGHPLLQINIPAQVGNAKAAGAAQHFADAVLPGQHRTVRQKHGRARRRLVVAAK